MPSHVCCAVWDKWHFSLLLMLTVPWCMKKTYWLFLPWLVPSTHKALQVNQHHLPFAGCRYLCLKQECGWVLGWPISPAGIRACGSSSSAYCPSSYGRGRGAWISWQAVHPSQTVESRVCFLWARGWLPGILHPSPVPPVLQRFYLQQSPRWQLCSIPTWSHLWTYTPWLTARGARAMPVASPSKPTASEKGKGTSCKKASKCQ